MCLTPHIHEGKGERYMPYQVKNRSSIPVALVAALLVSWAVTLLAAAVIAFLVAGERVGESGLSLMAVGAMVLSAVSGAVTGVRSAPNRQLPVSLACGGSYCLSLLGCNALFFEGQYQGIVPGLLTVMGASAAIGLMGLRKGQNFKRRKYGFKG